MQKREEERQEAEEKLGKVHQYRKKLKEERLVGVWQGLKQVFREPDETDRDLKKLKKK